jgi:hypothetical protein
MLDRPVASESGEQQQSIDRERTRPDEWPAEGFHAAADLGGTDRITRARTTL